MRVFLREADDRAESGERLAAAHAALHNPVESVAGQKISQRRGLYWHDAPVSHAQAAWEFRPVGC